MEHYSPENDTKTWTITQQDDKLEISNASELDSFVEELVNKVVK